MANQGGERTQIAEQAIELSEKIFPAFGWKRTGTTDHNFLGVAPTDSEEEIDEGEEEAPAEPVSAPKKVVKPKRSGVESGNQIPPTQEKNYPADAVYCYSDPYSDQQTFIHFDFKSYAETTIKAGTLRKDLRNLANVVAVAETSRDWESKFSPEITNYHIHGGLFVHNHDEKGLDKFNKFFAALSHASIKMARGKRLFVFSPSRIIYLNSIVEDFDKLRGKSKLPRPNEGEMSFFYPYGVRYKPTSNLLAYASVEILLGPLIIVRYRFNEKSMGQGYLIYYDGPGSETAEFSYIFEYLLKRRLLTGEDKVLVRMMYATSNCKLVFDKAKEDFIKFYHDLPTFRNLIESVEYSRLDTSRPNYSTVEKGAQ